MNKIQDDFKQITLLMGGAGGAIPFCTLRQIVLGLEKQASEGDEAAAEVLRCVTQFAALCRLAAKQCGCEKELKA